VCSKKRAKIVHFGSRTRSLPETENSLCQYFHAAHLQPMEAVEVTPENHTTVTTDANVFI
jgi:hypothetical protein